jgi:hypothetical protein
MSILATEARRVEARSGSALHPTARQLPIRSVGFQVDPSDGLAALISWGK